VVVKDGVLVSVKHSSSVLLSSSHTDGIRHTLTQGTSGALNTRGIVLRRGELGVTRGHAVVVIIISKGEK